MELTLIQFIVGLITTFGMITIAVLAVCSKLGFSFKKNSTSTQPSQCGMHTELQSTLSIIKDNQIRNIQKLEQHKTELEKGQTRFNDLVKEMRSLTEGVGILMDRSGGRPKNWRME